MDAGFTPRLNCPACQGASRLRLSLPYHSLREWLSNYYRVPVDFDGNYTVRECQRCGTYFQGEVASHPFLDRLYGEWIQPHDDPVNARDLDEIKLASRYLKRPIMRTLDYGMGCGAWATASLRLGHDSHGHDLSEVRMELARQVGIKTSMDGRFDFINTEQVFEHLSNPVAAIADLAGQLAPGGVIKVSVPSRHGIEGTIDRLKAGKPIDSSIMPIQPLEHINTFSRRGLKLLAGRHGLRSVRPSLLMQYAVATRTPKELVRPVYRWVAPRNLYMWFRKDAQASDHALPTDR